MSVMPSRDTVPHNLPRLAPVHRHVIHYRHRPSIALYALTCTAAVLAVRRLQCNHLQLG
jgi:hypothetical protein